MSKECLLSLREMTRGQRGSIVCLRCRDAAYLHKLMAMGVLPGEQVEVLQTSPAFVIRIGYTQIAMDSLLARVVEVNVAE